MYLNIEYDLSTHTQGIARKLLFEDYINFTLCAYTYCQLVRYIDSLFSVAINCIKQGPYYKHVDSIDSLRLVIMLYLCLR